MSKVLIEQSLKQHNQYERKGYPFKIFGKLAN